MDNVSKSNAISMIVDSDDEFDSVSKIEIANNQNLSTKVKTPSSSLGLSLLQSYDDLQDDSPSEDDGENEINNIDCKSDKNLSEICLNTNTTCKRLTIEESQPTLSLENNISQSNENVTNSGNCREIKLVESKTNDDQEVDEAVKSQIESNFTVTKHANEELETCDNSKSETKPEINGTTSVEYNTVVSDEHRTYKFEIFGKKVDDSESVLNKPPKKVKLNRSKFQRLSYETSGDASSSPPVNASPSLISNSLQNIEITTTNDKEPSIIDTASMNDEDSCKIGNESIMSSIDDGSDPKSSKEYFETENNAEEILATQNDDMIDDRASISIVTFDETKVEDAEIETQEHIAEEKEEEGEQQQHHHQDGEKEEESVVEDTEIRQLYEEEQEEEIEETSIDVWVPEDQEKLKNDEIMTEDDTENLESFSISNHIESKYESSDEDDVFKDAMESIVSDHDEQEIQSDELSTLIDEVESENIAGPSNDLNAEQKDEEFILIQDNEIKLTDHESTDSAPNQELKPGDRDVVEDKEELKQTSDVETESLHEKSPPEIEEISKTKEETVEINKPAPIEYISVKPSQSIPSNVSPVYRASEEPSKLQQALTRKLDPVRPIHSSEVTTSLEPDSRNIPAVNADTKENLKLHISLQGNRASIKKPVNLAETNESAPEVAPVADTTTEAVTQLPEPPRVKRKYTRRKPPIPVDQSTEQDGKSDGKAYKLRTRNAKKSEEGDMTPPATKKRKGGKMTAMPESIHAAAFPALSHQLQQPTVRLPYVHTVIDKAMTYPTLDPTTMRMQNVEKVQPLKLKIKCSPVTIEKVGGNTQKEMPLKIRSEPEMNPWSQPDMQRVERLLKDSNVTITPVVTSNAQPSAMESLMAMQHSIMPKDKCMPATITPITAAPSIYQSARMGESMVTTNLPYFSQSLSAKHNFNTLLKQVLRPDDRQIYHHDEISQTPSMSTVDVKSEIRKKLAQAERRKMSGTEENTPNVTPRMMKSVPGLLPINIASLPPGSEATSPMTTPQQSKIDALNAGESMIPETSTQMSSEMIIQTGTPAPLMNAPCIAANTFTSSTTPLPPVGYPKKRGRPTKAMVAARNAFRQSQEAMINRQMYQSGETMDSANTSSPHFMIPFEDRQMETISDTCSTPKARRTKKAKGEKIKEETATLLGDETSNDVIPINNEENEITDADREAEQLRKIEQERIRKEQERERKNELRRQKAKERSDLVRAKRLRQKQKAEERLKRVQEQRRLLQEEKKKLEEQIKKLPLEDAARMGMDDESMHSQHMSYSVGFDDDSSNTTSDTFQRARKSRMEVTIDADSDLTVDQIAEYQWPIQGGELYMIQEQISNFLGVKSFKRKYPDIKRRPVDSEERAYLVDSGLVSESLCDLGITAVCSTEVLDIMCNDFPDKYEELRRYMREKQMKELSFKQRAWANGLGYKLLMADGSKQDLKKRAMEAASNWNAALNKSRSDDRRCAMDLQTFIVHYPKSRAAKMTVPTPKIGSYPVSILPGQYSDFYKNYTSDELRYMPLNTILYGPLKPMEHGSTIADCSSQTESDDSSSSDESSSSTTSDATQDTEDTIEEIERDISLLLEDAGTADKIRDAFDESSKDAADVARREMLNGMREVLSGTMNVNREQEDRVDLNNRSIGIICKICLGNESRNKESLPEVLIRCSQCQSSSHPTCLDLSSQMVPHIKSYEWQCPDCKSCARCKENADEDKMLFCDNCDRGYHIYCVGLKKVPSGSWQCQECNSIETNDACNSISIGTTLR